MTVDIQEAIRCYHATSTPQRKDEHVVLILDKCLHMFPWESVPCLRGRSVSRLPSLGSLLERVTDSPIDGASWPTVEPSNGFYILNPEGDLIHTQNQFQNTLSKYGTSNAIAYSRIDGWSGIVGRPPMAQEILSAVRNRHIFLYYFPSTQLISGTLAMDPGNNM
jgi:separase